MSSLEHSTPATGSDPDAVILQLQDAAFGYGERPILQGANLSVRRGEVIAVLGPNGSGKSTLIKGVLGLNRQISGSVSLFGRPRSSFKEHWRVGYVPQRHTLSAAVTATAQEIVAAGRLTRRRFYMRPNAEDRRLIRRALEVVGLDDRRRTDVTTLSGGQQRRVLIARALAGQPDILLMDEPMAGVDAANQHVLAEVLERLVAQGVTMVIVTHELGALHRLLTRVLLVEDGHISFDGTPEEFSHLADEIHHDHDSGHHDHELEHPESHEPRRPVLPERGIW